jgi:hypothetical protein
MSLKIIFVLIALSCGAFVLRAEAVSAESKTVSQQLEVRAEVRPAIYVTVSERGEILQIASNSNQLPTPRVFVGDIDKDSEIPMTEDIKNQYQSLISDSNVDVGILYQSTPAEESADSLPGRAVIPAWALFSYLIRTPPIR